MIEAPQVSCYTLHHNIKYCALMLPICDQVVSEILSPIQNFFPPQTRAEQRGITFWSVSVMWLARKMRNSSVFPLYYRWVRWPGAKGKFRWEEALLAIRRMRTSDMPKRVVCMRDAVFSFCPCLKEKRKKKNQEEDAHFRGPKTRLDPGGRWFSSSSRDLMRTLKRLERVPPSWECVKILFSQR